MERVPLPRVTAGPDGWTWEGTPERDTGSCAGEGAPNVCEAVPGRDARDPGRRSFPPRSPSLSSRGMVMEAAREDPFLRKFELRRHKISTAAGTLSIVCLKSIDALLDRVGVEEFERDGHLPYWGDVWPVSVHIARACLRGPSLAGQRALDLGCGVGTAGVGAGKNGAVVTFGDRDEHALRFAAFNARQNGVASWSTTRMDWSTGALPGPFDLILCADVVYERRNYGPVLRQIEDSLAPGGTAIVGDPFREQSDAFFELAARRFEVEIEESSVHF